MALYILELHMQQEYGIQLNGHAHIPVHSSSYDACFEVDLYLYSPNRQLNATIFCFKECVMHFPTFDIDDVVLYSVCQNQLWE